MDLTPFEQLRRTAAAYQASCVLAAAAELDVFTLIIKHDNKLDAKKLSDELRADMRGLSALLDALTALQFLYKHSSGENVIYAVPTEYCFLLDSRRDDSFIPMLRHMANGQRNWGHLAETVLSGEPPRRSASILGQEQDQISFIQGMNSLAWNAAPIVVESLKEMGLLDFKDKSVRILDIGGASGTYTMAFLRALPQAYGTIFDLPVAIEEAKKRFSGTELAQRVYYQPGDFYKDDLPQGFDLAWISAIIHQHDQAASTDLFRKALFALKPGGKALIRDFIIDDSRTHPRSAALFAVNMLIHTKNGRVYTYKEIEQALKEAGFRQVELLRESEAMSSIVQGFKPM